MLWASAKLFISFVFTDYKQFHNLKSHPERCRIAVNLIFAFFAILVKAGC